MSEVQQEKDYFWFYVGGLVVAIVLVVVMIKGAEHDKYASTAKAIQEDSSYQGRTTKNN
jgi:bacteriorhodopsin